MTTVADCMLRWIDSRSGRVIDTKNEYSRWEVHVLPHPLFQGPMEAVRQYEIQDFVHELGRTRSAQTARHVLRQLRQTYDYAVSRDLCTHNPTIGVRVPGDRRSEETWTFLSNEEIRILLDCKALSVQTREAIGLSVFTGLRLGELLHLRWEDVTLEGRRPEIVVRHSNGFRPPKSGRVGRIPLLPMARSILEARALRGREGLVFGRSDGRPYSKGYDFGWRPRKAQPGALQLAGIERRVRWHDLRHTTASQLIGGGWGEPWSLLEVCRFMRHSSVKVTERYTHLGPEALHERAAACRIGN